jgi:hypothetical protein
MSVEANVADEYAALPDGEPIYTELQSIANALTYEIYLSEVDKQPLTTDLTGTVAEVLADHGVEYGDWYAQHLEAETADEIVLLFRENTDLFKTAADVVQALRRDDAVRQMESIADHPWVEIIEQGQHRREDTVPFRPEYHRITLRSCFKGETVESCYCRARPPLTPELIRL